MDLKRGIFTVPITGVYYFDFFFFWSDIKDPESSNPGFQTVDLSLVLNGMKHIWLYSEVRSITVNQWSYDGHHIKLTKGDQIWVHMSPEHIFGPEKTTFNFFGMFLG